MITPNGDGVNDVVDYSAIADKQNLVLTIFDRYGTKIHQETKPTVINGTEK
jgi:gliding motility-associated-like protein